MTQPAQKPELKPSDPKGPMTQVIPPVTAPEQDEALGRVIPSVEVRERKRDDAQILDIDPETADPNLHYRWVRLDPNNRSINRHKRLGYQIEYRKGKGGRPGVRTLAEPDSRADGAICIGDLILMSCPKYLAEQRQETRRRRDEARLQSTSAQTEQMAKEKGVRIIKDPDHDRETITGAGG